MERARSAASPEEHREQILSEAAAQLAARGFDGVRLRDVAKAAGVSIGLLQHYFETRDGLFEEAFAWSIDDLIARWRTAAARESGEWRRVVLLVDELTADPAIGRRSATWTEFCAAAARHPRLRPGVRRVYALWRELMTDIVTGGVAHGIFHPPMPEEHAIEVLVALVDGFDMAIAANGGLPDGPSDAARYRAILLDAIRATLGVSGDAAS